MKATGMAASLVSVSRIRLVIGLALTLVAWLALGATPASAQNPLSAGGPQPAEAELDRSSPRATMATFMAIAAEAEDQSNQWQRAAQCLAVPQTLQAQASERAEALYSVLSKLEPHEQQLLDATTVERTGATHFRFFPRDQHHAWLAEQLPGGANAYQALKAHPIELVRNEAGQWLFSEQTVREVPALQQNLAAVPAGGELNSFEKALRWLGPTFERTTKWGWLGLLLAVAIGVVLGRIAKAIFNRLANRFGKTTWGLRSTVLHDAAAPASLLILTIALTIGFGLIYKEGTVQRTIEGTLELLYILSIGWFVYNLVDTVEFTLRRVTAKRNHKLNESVIPMVRRTLRVFVVIVLLLLIAQNVFNMNITGLIAGLGVAGLAISLAAQESVKNVFGSLTVFFDKAFAVGDFITFGTYTGIVEEIGFRSTRIRLLNGNLVTIPNMKFIDGDIENIGARPYIRRVMDITITYDTPPEKIQQALEIVRDLLNNDSDVVEQGQFDMTNFPPRIAFDELNNDSFNIKAYYWYQLNKSPERTYWTYLHHCELVNRKLVERFEQAGIDFAFPTQTLYLAGDDKRQLSVRMLQQNSSA